MDESVPAGEAIEEAEAVITAKSGKSNGLLILFVQKIGDAAGERNAAGDEITGSEVETRVSRIPSDARAGTGVPGEGAVKIAVRAHAGEIACQIKVESAKVGVQPEVAGVRWSAKPMIPRLLEGGRVGHRFDYAAVVIRVVSF